MNLLGDNINKSISLLKDPFAKDLVSKIVIIVDKDWDKYIKVYADVEFQNGATRGIQNFKGSDFNTVVKEMQTFIETLKP
jgi:hypothetical protein